MPYADKDRQVYEERVERKMFGVSLSRKNDPELFAFLESKPNVSLYIKTVLYADMKMCILTKERNQRIKAHKEHIRQTRIALMQEEASVKAQA